MATLIIRSIDAAVKERLRVHGAQNGHIMEAEARRILQRGPPKDEDRSSGGDFYDRIQARFPAHGGIDADITYIPMAKGFVYLVAVMDWFSRRVLSWRLSIAMETNFCFEALVEAIERYGQPDIFNTDQGVQFTSAAFVDELADRGVRISMDGKGRYLDYPATIWMVIVLPHPGMLPSGLGIASPGCSRRRVTLSIGGSAKPAFLFDRRACFPAPTWRRSSHGAQRRGREERSHPEPRTARPFARAWRGWRASDLPRSEHRGTLRTSRRIRPPPRH